MLSDGVDAERSQPWVGVSGAASRVPPVSRRPPLDGYRLSCVSAMRRRPSEPRIRGLLGVDNVPDIHISLVSGDSELGVCRAGHSLAESPDPVGR